MIVGMKHDSGEYGSASFPTVFGVWTPSLLNEVSKVYFDRVYKLYTTSTELGAVAYVKDFRITLNLHGKKVKFTQGANTTQTGSLMLAMFSDTDVAGTAPIVSAQQSFTSFVYFRD